MEKISGVKAVKQRSSDMAFCADDFRLFCANGKTETKKKWMASRDLWIAEIDGSRRVITPVITRPSSLTTELDYEQKAYNNNPRKKGAYKGKEEPYQLLWMDCITGSLFDNSGLCKSSDQLKLDTMNIYKNDTEAALILMSAKAVELKSDKDWNDLPV